jgi:hypothetical protein
VTQLPPTGDIVDILLAQHEQITEYLDDVACATGQKRVEAFKTLQRVLRVHEEGEQHVVHPVTRDAAVAPEVATARIAEERRADLALAELRQLGLDSDEFDAKFAEFRAAVLEHARLEQDEEFPLLRKTQTNERLLAMANQLRTVQSMA